jgi:undecaprenyl pyrophosphate synthase
MLSLGSQSVRRVLQVTGPALTLAGFPAWTVRTSEIYGVGPLARLDAVALQAALSRFCTTKQRFGK